jgi:signal transduction histidine kinase/CheY-like chemotaxis protein
MSFAAVLGSITVLLWAALVVLLAWARPPRPLWPLVFWLALGGLLWSLGDLGSSFFAQSAGSHWYWLLVLYSGVLLCGPLWFSLSLKLVAQQGVRPGWATVSLERALFTLALVCLLALLTNPWHGLFIEPMLEGRNLYRPFWYLQAFYNYSCMLASVLAIIWSLRRRDRPDERTSLRLRILVVASVLPLVGNLVYLSRILDSDYDPTHLGFGIGLLLVFFGIARAGLFAVSGLTLEHWLDSDCDGVALLDGEGRLIRANAAAAELLSVDELAPDADFVALLASRLTGFGPGPEGRERLFELLRSTEGPREGHVFRVAAPRRWLRIQSTRIPGRWPTASGLGVRVRDETQLRETSEGAARQAASIEAILGSIRDGLFVVDEEGRLLYANERFWQMWRLPRVVPLSTDETHLIAELATRLENGRALLAANRTRENLGEEQGLDLALKSGQIFSVTVATLMRRQSRAGRVWTFRDVTERRRAALDRMRIEERIRESQKLESLGVLAGGIAHDFNNILVGILGNVDLVTAKLDPGSPPNRHLASIKSSADRAAELIQQLLAYAGRGRVVIATLDLAALVEETKDLVRSAISKKAHLRIELTRRCFVEGDPVQLRQIIMNLITNASDALGDEAGTITLRTGVKSLPPGALEDAVPLEGTREGEFAFLEITDTGCGMDGKTLARIFEPFYSTKFTGRGLGLSAALGIMRSHHGFIKVRSAPGEGTTFLLLLPLAEAVAEVSPRAAPGARAEAPFGPATVLVVDDEEVVRDVARSALEMGGYRVLVAKDGHEAVSLFRENADGIEAIILDLTMPRMDGAEALFAIRQIAREVPVILSSGYSEEDTMARSAGIPGVSFIQKPYTPARLVARVSDALRAGRVNS